MPKFTLTKHSDFEGDPEVSLTFSTDLLNVLRNNLDDFIIASGFEVETDFIAKEEDWMWNDAISSKFGADVIKFPNLHSISLGDK